MAAEEPTTELPATPGRFPLAWAILRVLVAFGVLSAFYVGAKEPFAAYFRAVFEFVFVLLTSFDIEFLSPSELEALTGQPHASKATDTAMMVFRGEGDGRLPKFGYLCDSRFVALVPLTIYLALSAGPRMPWARRWRATLVGVAFVHLYVFLRLCVYLLGQWTDNAAQHGFLDSPGFLASDTWAWTLDKLDKLQSDPAIYVTVPVLIWGLVSFRRLDWETLLARRPRGGAVSG